MLKAHPSNRTSHKTSRISEKPRGRKPYPRDEKNKPNQINFFNNNFNNKNLKWQDNSSSI